VRAEVSWLMMIAHAAAKSMMRIFVRVVAL